MQRGTEKKSLNNPSKLAFPVVGVGASAGGLEALEQFFRNSPGSSGMAYVVVQHLDPDHICVMPELLQRVTSMKVIQVSNRLKIQPNCIYTIPPNKSMSVLNGVLHLFNPVETRGLRLPIDFFFRALAEDLNELSVGVILSGMGSDGSLGLKAIKEKNGLVLVQEPLSAKYDSMPRHAMEAVTPDIVAPADELIERLEAFLKVIPKHEPDLVKVRNYKSNLEKIIILLRDSSGHDFSLYKKNTLFRRIERRKLIHQIDTLAAYVGFLQQNPKELEILFKELLISVTSFFRDPEVWQALAELVLPGMLKELPDNYLVRAWVVGCSTGEEAYSLAILFKEAVQKQKDKKNIAFQIFATDINVEAVEKARRGVYTKNIEADVSFERLNKFFISEGETYRVSEAIREMVIFAPVNIIKDPPFTRIDVVTCRNMLIYMEPILQNKILGLFKYCINPAGYIVLGKAETPGIMQEGLNEIAGGMKIYKCLPTIIKQEIKDFPSSVYKALPSKTIKKTTPVMVENIQTIADQILIQRFSPASVMINDDGDILYITGRTGKYLEPAAGKANWNIHAMAREGLRDGLATALRKSRQNYDAVTIRNNKLGTQSGKQLVDVTAQRIEKPDSVKDMTIIVFNDVPTVIESETKNLKTRRPPKSEERQKELEIELRQSNEELIRIREEMQISQEELQSTNEELQSTNEELQSTNEELTTSKEEMQSLNEELQTVNAELQSKINDYAQAFDDMKNLLNSTEIATLFLDKNLNVRRYTDKLTNIFKLRISDIGRPFTDLVNELHYPEIENHARQVLKTLVAFENEITSNNNRWFNIRIMPYRTIDDRIDGLVMTFMDFTEYKNMEMELISARELLKKTGGQL